jgi:hypothetical protein
MEAPFLSFSLEAQRTIYFLKDKHMRSRGRRKLMQLPQKQNGISAGVYYERARKDLPISRQITMILDGNKYTDMGFLTIFGEWTGRASG